MIIVLKIRHSGEDYEVFLCKTQDVAERIIREWFAGYNIQNCIEAHIVIETGRTVPTLEELENYLTHFDIGYWEITEQEIIS